MVSFVCDNVCMYGGGGLIWLASWSRNTQVVGSILTAGSSYLLDKGFNLKLPPTTLEYNGCQSSWGVTCDRLASCPGGTLFSAACAMKPEIKAPTGFAIGPEAMAAVTYFIVFISGNQSNYCL